MAEDSSVKVAKDSIALVGEVIRAAGDSPQVKEAANNLGQTAVTLTKTINNALLPLAAINYACDKAREYFAKEFVQDIAAKAEAIPPEHIVEPKASIAGPTLQGLAFSHEEENLKEMFLNLLATAMDGRAASVAHPAFVEVVKQLDSEDARLVRTALRSASAIPIIQLRYRNDDGSGYHVSVPHILDLHDVDTGEPVVNKSLPAMIDNWVRLGLVTVDYGTHLVSPDRYSWAEQRPEFLQGLSNPLDGKTLTYQKGIMQRTEFGIRFAKAVGLLNS